MESYESGYRRSSKMGRGKWRDMGVGVGVGVEKKIEKDGGERNREAWQRAWEMLCDERQGDGEVWEIEQSGGGGDGEQEQRRDIDGGVGREGTRGERLVRYTISARSWPNLGSTQLSSSASRLRLLPASASGRRRFRRDLFSADRISLVKEDCFTERVSAGSPGM